MKSAKACISSCSTINSTIKGKCHNDFQITKKLPESQENWAVAASAQKNAITSSPDGNRTFAVWSSAVTSGPVEKKGTETEKIKNAPWERKIEYQF